MQAAPYFIHSCHPSTWEGWWGAKSLSIPLGSIVEKLWGGLLPVRLCAAVVSSLFLPSSLRRELTDWGVGLASAWLWCHYKVLPGPKPIPNESLPMNEKGWLWNKRSERPGWPWNIRTSEQGWLKRRAPPSGNSSLKQAQLAQLGYFPDASPPAPILLWFPYVTWVRHWLPLCNEEQMPQWPPLHQSLMAHRSQPPQTALYIKLRLHLFPLFPCWTLPLLASSSWALSSGSLPIPNTKVGSLPQWCTQWLTVQEGQCPKLQRPMSAVATALHRAIENCLRCHWRCPTMAWLPLGVLKNMRVRTTLITVVMSLPKTSQGRMWPFLIWNQPLGIVSLVWTLRKWSLELHKRRFQKKVQTSWSIARGSLWSEAQLKWIKYSHQVIWESDYEIIWTEWEITLKEEHTSFEVNKVRINQLLQIKEATHSKIHTQESEAEVNGLRKTLMQSLKQFPACFYWLYEKGMTQAMVSLQGLHMSDTFRCSNISANMGLKLKLKLNIFAIAITSP